MNNPQDLHITDCHLHIVDPIRFPFPEGPGYRPKVDEVGTAEAFFEVMKTNGITHGLLVQPSGYAFDNRAMLDAIRKSGGRFKGIAVVSPTIQDRELQRLDDVGVKGIRFNLMDFQADALSGGNVHLLLERVREMDWFVDIQCQASHFPEASSLLLKTGVKVIIDHLGRPDPRKGINEAGFQEMLSFATGGRAVLKLSGPFRESIGSYPYADINPFVKVLLEAFTTENCVWGSDWPFLNLKRKPSYGEALSSLSRWLPEEANRRKVLWDVPARLFGFKEIAAEVPKQ